MAEVDMRAHVLRVERNRLPVMLLGTVVVLAHIIQQKAEVVVRQRVLRVELDRLPEMQLGAVVVLAHVLQHAAEVVVRHRVLRVERDAPRVRLEFGLAALLPVLPVIRVPERKPRLAIFRLQLDAFLERYDGLGPAFLLIERHALREQRRR